MMPENSKRDISQAEIDLRNKIKEKAEEVGELCSELNAFCQKIYTGNINQRDTELSEQAEAIHWLSAGELQLQLGFMALTRSIDRPKSF